MRIVSSPQVHWPDDKRQAGRNDLSSLEVWLVVEVEEGVVKLVVVMVVVVVVVVVETVVCLLCRIAMAVSWRPSVEK